MSSLGNILSGVLCGVLVVLILNILFFKKPLFKKSHQLIYDQSMLNMANTVEPILSSIAEDACGYENMQTGDGPALGGRLIYKREKNDMLKSETCISGTGNYYYIRCYEWGYDDKGGWQRPIKDVPLDSFSCIDEHEVTIPFHDRQLQEAEMGKKYYR